LPSSRESKGTARSGKEEAEGVSARWSPTSGFYVQFLWHKKIELKFSNACFHKFFLNPM
jgi:hypothetical protein